jgi:hypothetical protein
MGIEFDGWQNGLGSLLLAKKANGRIAHTVGGFGLSAMRQVGKTYFYCGAFFGMCQEYPGLLVVWSAHHSKTHMETFLSMQEFASRRRVKPFIDKVYTGSGDESVVFNNGSRILFGARERGFGRGIPGVDVLMNDEGQILSEKAVDAMTPTLNTSEIGIHIYAGTPPKPDDNSGKWMRMRDEAWAIEDPSIVQVQTEDIVWVEIGAREGTQIGDIDATCEANPSWPHRTPTESIMRLIRNLKNDGIRREAQGLYDESEGSEFDMAKWKTLADPEAPQPTRAALVLDVSPNRGWSCIGVAAELPKDSTDDPDRSLVLIQSIRGTAGVVEKVAQMRDDHDLIEVAITGGAARALETDLTKANIEYERLNAGDMSAAYSNLQEAIKNGTVVHTDQPELNFALANARSRFLQTGEAESFDRREYDIDVSPAVAAAGALYRLGINNAPMPFIL